MSPRRSPSGTAAAPLLYWLLVVCGLAGITLMRLETPQELVPLWVGAVVGVALGQALAWLRMRAWLLGVFVMGAFWFAPVFFFVVYESFGGAAKTCIFAFLPAAFCGYLSLSERGGLAAFWFPAVLWMLVILDGPTPGVFDTRAALPLLLGLAALFVAFLRARETRRAAIWNTHGMPRLASPMPRTVLRASPLRAASQVAWTGFVGASALVLTAWIAPHLWQKEHDKQASAAAAAAQQAAAGPGSNEGAAPCCADNAADVKRSRVREYFPLSRTTDEDEFKAAASSCVACRNGQPIADGDQASTSGNASSTSPTSTATADTATPPGAVPADTVAPIAPAVAPVATTTPTSATPQVSRPTSGPRLSRPVAIVLVPKPAAPLDTGTPWRSVLAFCIGGLGLHVLLRATRRQLTLRHLARPFWSETLDQRISNDWQRMLIGLRDAGIHTKPDEQPHALARRVGIEGMDVCSTILERVRHGVRVDANDLETMDSAANAVYRTARDRAGVSGRAAGWLRWPLT